MSLAFESTDRFLDETKSFHQFSKDVLVEKYISPLIKLNKSLSCHVSLCFQDSKYLLRYVRCCTRYKISLSETQSLFQGRGKVCAVLVAIKKWILFYVNIG